VDDFHDGAQADGTVAGVSEELCRQQQQGGTQALAATLTQVLADLRDGFDLAARVAAKLLLDQGEVIAEQVEDFFSGSGGQAVHVG
jgi:hypothetical protein